MMETQSSIAAPASWSSSGRKGLILSMLQINFSGFRVWNVQEAAMVCGLNCLDFEWLWKGSSIEFRPLRSCDSLAAVLDRVPTTSRGVPQLDDVPAAVHRLRQPLRDGWRREDWGGRGRVCGTFMVHSSVIAVGWISFNFRCCGR